MWRNLRDEIEDYKAMMLERIEDEQWTDEQYIAEIQRELKLSDANDVLEYNRVAAFHNECAIWLTVEFNYRCLYRINLN